MKPFTVIATMADLITSSEDTGGTLSTVGEALPTTGYWVGGAHSEIVFTRDTDRDFLLYSIQHFLEESQASWLGWWVNPDTGHVHLDSTTWVEGYHDAENLCRQREEIAFYDIANGRDFRPVILP